MAHCIGYNQRIFTNIQEDLISDEYRKGMSSYELAKKYEVGRTTIQRILKRQKQVLRSMSEAKRKYKLNEKVFDEINDHSAYWIGFLMADGNIGIGRGKNLTINVNLQRIDENHLCKFRDFLCSDHKICYSKNGDIARFTCSSRRLALALIGFGVVPRKSLIAEVNNNLLLNNRHFWRGVIDGDGCIQIDRFAHRCSLDLVSASRKLIEQYFCYIKGQNSLIESTIRENKALKTRWHDQYTVRVGSGRAKKLVELLYTNAKDYLDRKMIKATEVMSLPDFEFTRRGDRNGNSKLTSEQVNSIRLLAGKVKVSELAKSYSVSWTAIKYILLNKTWKHLLSVVNVRGKK